MRTLETEEIGKAYGGRQVVRGVEELDVVVHFEAA